MANDKSSKGVGGARGSKTSALSVGIWIFSGTTQIYVFVFVFVFFFPSAFFGAKVREESAYLFFFCLEDQKLFTNCSIVQYSEMTNQ